MPRPPKYIAAAASSLAQAAAGLFVGTSGWAYPSWKPDFYPKEVPSRAFLHYYASRLTAVEVNFTFRALPSAEQLEGWLAATPPGFQFSFKAPQRITHFARLQNCADAVNHLVRALEPARSAGRLGPVLFQLPPNFQAAPDRLAALLQTPSLQGKGAPRLAFEFRHPSWFTSVVFDTLREHNAALCIADTDDLQTPEVHTADFFCYRLRRDGGYTAAELDGMASRFTSLARQAETFVFFRHQEQPTGALNAVGLLQRSVAHSESAR